MIRLGWFAAGAVVGGVIGAYAARDLVWNAIADEVIRENEAAEREAEDFVRKFVAEGETS